MLDELYKDVGKKIKALAQWFFGIEALASMIAGIILLADAFVLEGLITILVGPLVALISSWFLYAFGSLVDDLHAVRNQTFLLNNGVKNLHLFLRPKNNPKPVEHIEPKVKEPVSENKIPNEVTPDYWVCGKCKTKNLNSRQDCWSCGNKK